MKKCEIFPIFDKQKRQIQQVNSLATVLEHAGGLDFDSKDTLGDCIGLVCDLTEDIQTNHDSMSKALAELYIVDNAVHGSSD
jgi:hypothetical protein